MFFYPKWKKEALNIYKAGKKFLNYKRDLLSEDRISEIKFRLSDLKDAHKGWNAEAKTKTEEAIRQLDNTCQEALPKQRKVDPLGENIEVIFVSLVVALGIRSYYVQPFRIPTGSMQPSLNGVISKAQDKSEWPNPIIRAGELVLRGRGYVYQEAKQDLIIPEKVANYAKFQRQLPNGFVQQNKGFYQKIQTFHTVSHIPFKNTTINIHGIPASDLYGRGEMSLANVINERGVTLPNGDVKIPKGTVLVSGHSDSGDLILADKVSYHFRKPKRGETFIFDTRGINTNVGLPDRVSSLINQSAATHYIKRCVGVPGDTLQIAAPELLVNGAPAQEPYIRRVIQAEGVYALAGGYKQADRRNYPNAPMVNPSQKLNLRDHTKKPWRSEYAAMGDNTANSLDSRYWGALEEYNVVAPAFFSLWPFTTGHWGIIK